MVLSVSHILMTAQDISVCAQHAMKDNEGQLWTHETTTSVLMVLSVSHILMTAQDISVGAQPAMKDNEGQL